MVLGIEQREGKRGTVQTGRAFHNRHSTTNKNYKIKHLDGIKQNELLFYSKKHSFAGKIDAAIETEKEIILIERKYSDYVLIGTTLKTQLGLLAILAEENTGKKVNKAIVVFDKTERVEIPINITEKIKQDAILMLQKANNTITTGNMPYSKHDGRCLNCCYRKICPPA
jgi:CRISPR-associated exonuclease Cas4